MKKNFIKIFKTLVLVVLMFAINISCTKKRTYVEIVNGKLKVYPTELGLYDSIPYDTISKINESEVYGYDTWRLPTTEELSLLKEKGYLSKKEYMTEENKKGMVLLVTDNLYAKALREKEEKLARAKEYDDWINGLYNQEHDFIDLGLSVKWASCNVGANSPEEYGEYLEDVWKEDSLSRHVAWRVPSVDEFNELIDKCKWTWTKLNDVNGYDITGPNGNSIFLPATGYYGYDGEFYVNEACRYLSSTPAYKGYEWCTYYLWADSSEYHTYLINFRWRLQTVRPVLDPENVSEYMRLGTLAALEDDYDKAKLLEILHALHLYEELADRTNDVLHYLNTTGSDQYSSGQKQRLALARTLLNVDETTQIIAFDEVTNNLNDEIALQVLKYIQSRYKECIILFATHQIAIANQIANRHLEFTRSSDDTFFCVKEI